MRFLVLKSKLFDKGEDRNEEVDCDNCSKYRSYFGVLWRDFYKTTKAKRYTNYKLKWISNSKAEDE